MTIYKRREFKTGDLVCLNQTKLQDIPASLVSLVLKTVTKVTPRFRVIEVTNGLATIKHTSTAEEFNVSVATLIAAFNNSNKGNKKIVVVDVGGVEIFGRLTKYTYRVTGKIKKEDGGIITFNSSKNNLGFVEKI